jgi:DNA polymerase-3 subunit gamma/tau
VKFLLATTDPQKLPVTVLSRCLQFNLKRLPVEQIVGHLELIVRQEGVPYDLPALKHLARAADGSMRDALSLLDQAIAHGGGVLTADDVRAMLGTLSSDRVGELLSALAERDGSRLMRCIAEMAEQVVDFTAALQALVTQLQRLAVFQLVPDAIHAEDDDVALLERLAARLDPAEVQLYYQIGLMAGRDLPLAPAPRLGFEMAMLRMLAFAPDGGVEDRVGPAERPADAETHPRAEPSAERRPRLEAEGWAHAVAAMSLTGLVRELAANVHPVRIEGGRVELRLAPGHAHLDTKNLREQLEAALTDYCGERIRVMVSFGEPAMETPADQRRKVDERRQQAAIESMESDANVRAIVDAFDAVLDKSSIRPVDNEA